MFFKKFICILFVFMIVMLSAFGVSAYHSSGDEGVLSVKEAVKEYEQENQVKIDTYRYYFLEPDGKTGLKNDNGEFVDSWLFDGYEKNTPSLYWWEVDDCPNPDAWVGYKFDGKVNGYSVWYADVPKNVQYFKISNGNFEMPDDKRKPDSVSRETFEVFTDKKYYNGEYPSDLLNFDNMIFVINFDKSEPNNSWGYDYALGHWYYYYGGSCFGDDPDGASDLDHYCLNAAHAGSHHDADYEKTVLTGDADGDGEITVTDATRIQQYLAHIIDETKIDLDAAKTTGDDLSVIDATRIQQHLAKLINLEA